MEEIVNRRRNVLTFAENSITIPVANNEEIRQLLVVLTSMLPCWNVILKSISFHRAMPLLKENREDTEKVAFLFRELLCCCSRDKSLLFLT